MMALDYRKWAGFKTCAGKENSFDFKRLLLILGKHGLMSTWACFIYALLSKNVAYRRQLAGKGKGRAQKKSNDERGYHNEGKFLKMACHFTCAPFLTLLSYKQS
jgi:hypothetical protein